MKNFNQYIYEAWGSNKSISSYRYSLEDLFDDYDKAVEVKKKKDSRQHPSGGPGRSVAGKDPAEKLAKYPTQILIDKAGFSPKMIKKHYWQKADDPKNLKMDAAHYGQFILDELEKGTFTKEDLINWWQEYENNILKNKWCDLKWVIKQVDGSRFWNPWQPNDDSMVTDLMNNPEKLITYVRSDEAKFYRLSEDERTEILGFWADPVNHETLVKGMKSYRKQLEKIRPTNDIAAAEIYKNLLDGNVYVDGKKFNLEDKLYYKETKKVRYEGSNDTESEYSSAIMSMINTSLVEMYGIRFDSSVDWDDIYDDWGETKYKRKFSTKNSEGSKISHFVEDGGNGITFKFKDLGSSKNSGESGPVHSSSFWTYYRHDFELEVFVYPDKDKPKYTKKFEGITTASCYYSGGWN